ncbi:galactitol-1-phosphate 5-dehydrogenase [soil metagenome]
MFTGKGSIVLEDVPEPVPAADEVVVTVEAVGICGSEIEAYVGTSTGRRPPLIFGHEMSVTIDGEPQRYVVNPLRTCGHCRACVSGWSNLCENRSLLSLHRNGGYAQRAVVRRDELFAVSPGVSAIAAAVVEPASTAQHALEVPGGLEGKRVLIIGCGSLGLLGVQIALASGASEVIACDVVPSRRELAAAYGARAVSEITPGDRSDIVVDMVGSQVTRRLAIQACRAGGYVRLVGLLAQESLLPVLDLIAGGLHVEGIYAYRTSHIEQAIRLIEEGKIDVEPMVTVGRLQDAPEFFETLAKDPGKWVKVVMQP